MSNHAPPGPLSSVRKLLEVQALRATDDRELLQRIAATNDQAAFRVLAERHGPMVLGVCRRALRCPHDAEDAFQATFLILWQRAASIRKSDGLASWLHGVARRVATRLQREQRRRSRREQAILPQPSESPMDGLSWAEVKTGLDEELERLPNVYREVLVLCYLEGLARDEAAQRLGVEVSVVKGRLERGRKMLAERLSRRGLTLGAGLLSIALSPGVVSATVRAAALVAAGDPAAAAAVAPVVLSLTNEVLKGMAMSKMKLIGASLACVLILAVGVGIAQQPTTGSAKFEGPRVVSPATGPVQPKDPDVKRWAKLSLHRAKVSLPENYDPDMMKRVLEQARLQGEWLPKYLLTKNGLERYPLKGRWLDFTDTTFTQTEGRRRVQTGTFQLDPSSRGLDLIVEQHEAWDVGATPQKPKVPHTLKCGYRVTGDLLTVCYTAGKDRPADLTPGEGRTVVVYERVR